MSREQFRNECEARHVLKMPTIAQRRQYLAGVGAKRGIEAQRYLEAEIMRQHKAQNQ